MFTHDTLQKLCKSESNESFIIQPDQLQFAVTRALKSSQRLVLRPAKSLQRNRFVTTHRQQRQHQPKTTIKVRQPQK